MNRKEFLTTVLCSGTGAVACSALPCCGLTNQTNKAENENKTAAADETLKFADAWVKRMMTVVDSQLDPSSRERLLENMGRACYIAQHGPRPAEVPAGSLDRLIARLKKWAGEEGVRRAENAIHFTYGPAGADKRRCLCPMVESITEGLSPTYCQCSTGYVREMFEQATGKSVEVTLTESLKRGGKACRFLIQL